MTKKNLSLIILVLLLGGFSLYLNRDRFRSTPIHISSRNVRPRGWLERRARNKPSNPVIFLLDRKLKLTSVKVFLTSDAETNKYPHAIWELITDSNSVPVKNFVYGVNIRGMKPGVRGATADPLKPGVEYRVRIQAGSLRAEHDFIPVPHTR